MVSSDGLSEQYVRRFQVARDYRWCNVSSVNF